jgi:cytochrome c oxidase subunit 2
LFPTSASTVSPGVDHLYFLLLAVSAVMTALIFIAIFFFAIRYRRRPGNLTASQIEGSTRLELAWAVLPFLVMMSFFAWGAELYFRNADPPADASVIYVVAKQWMWKLQHPQGPREINELHVPVGRPVRLIMTSEDVIHSFFVPAFRIKQDVLPGRYTQVWFEATKTGNYHLFCAEYCGTDHSRMGGWIYVMEPAEYQRWLSGGAVGESMVAAGERLFGTLGCPICHVRDAPPLHGLYGSRVPLSDGSTVIADDAYLRQSILNPTSQIVRGYSPLMPTYEGQVTEEGLLQLIAYIKSLTAEPPAPKQPRKEAP